ncbi:MAG: efflux RND transporter periplasmic adaptor subunit [Polyangiaceae bacterium]|nr:efflux RND transporter periplasmic adaptor subunit [Polyangiaceae bacterium]
MLRSLFGPVAAAALLSFAAGCRGEAKAGVEPAAPPVDIQLEAAKAGPVPRTVKLTGSLRGEQESDLAANASGRVIEMPVDAGQAVKKGDVLARLDTRAVSLVASEAKAQAELAKTRREQAKRECERAKGLLEAGAISKSEYDRTQDQCKTSDIDVRAAEARAGQASQTVVDGVVRAPFDGVVVERLIEPGEYVRADTPIVRVATVDRLRLKIEVPEAHVASARVGAAVTFSVSAFPGRKWTAAIDRRGVAVRTQSRDVVAEASLANTDGTLLPGMFATVDLAVGEDELPTIPAAAIVMREGRSHAFVEVDGRATERVLSLGPEVAEGRVAVRRGIKAGESVVVGPPADLKNGSQVH